MKFKTTLARLFQQKTTGGYTLDIDIDRSQFHMLDDLNKLIHSNKTLEFEIKQYRSKRSNQANALLWLLMDKISRKLATSKDEVYLDMLDRYGVFTHVVVKKQYVERVKREWRTVRELGEIEVNGKPGVQLQCFFGSSTYNTLEFSQLLNGVVSECKELGIETATPNEIAEMMALYEQKGEK